MPLKNRRALLLVNPKAGKQAAQNQIYKIIKHLSETYTLTVHLTEGPGDAILAASVASEFDAVICCGGDGTLSQTVQGLMTIPNRPAIGYLPCGTANDVASTLELSRNFQMSAKTVCEGTPHPQDVGKINGRPFVYVASFGTFARSSYETPQEVKNIFGQLAYFFNGISDLANIYSEKVTVVYDEGEVSFDDVTLLTVNNTASIGGVVKLPSNQFALDDGKFEILIIRKPKNIIELQNAFFAMTRGDFSHKLVTLLHTAHAKITVSRPVDWTVDGESGGKMDCAEIEVVPSAIQIIR